MVVVGLAIWHFAMLSSLGLITGLYAETWGLAPKRVVLSSQHLLGVASVSAGAAIIIAAQSIERLGTGILIGGAFVLLDVYLTGLAFRSLRPSWRRKQRKP